MNHMINYLLAPGVRW
jgi:primosomal protein N'